MGSGNSMDELNRAAEAAGFAMAGAADDFDDASLVTSAKIPVEYVARGARPARPVSADHSTSNNRSRLTSGALAVRESVYGYLGLGLPA